MPKKPLNIDQIDSLLPQTQCGLCEHEGCRPYAQAIANQQDSIDKCLPGGIPVLNQLSKLTGIDSTLYEADMQVKAKPAQKVIVREDLCIGCTKCIQACPVDAIIGASKAMHTVILDDCTGCELCIEPCPMDCIDIIPIKPLSESEQLASANLNRQRYLDRNARLARLANEKRTKHLHAKVKKTSSTETLTARRSAIAEAIARSKAKKNNVTQGRSS